MSSREDGPKPDQGEGSSTKAIGRSMRDGPSTSAVHRPEADFIQRAIRWTSLPVESHIVRLTLSALAVLLVDIMVPAGIEVSLLYIAVVLSAVPLRHPRAIYATACVCSVLILIGWIFNSDLDSLAPWKVIANRALALGAIWTTAAIANSWNRLQRRQADHLQENRLLHQAMMLSIATESFDESLYNCIRIICETTGWPVGQVYLLDADRRHLSPSGIWYESDPERYATLRASLQDNEFTKGEGLPGRVWELGTANWTASDEDDERLQSSADIGLRGIVGFPVNLDDELVAVIEFFTPDRIAPDPHRFSLIGNIGDQLGRLIERRRLMEERARQAAIVESSYDAIIGKDRAGRIISWNTGAQQVYGYTEEEALDQPISIILPEGMHQEEPQVLEAIRSGRQLAQFEGTRRRKDGTLVHVALTVSPIRDGRGFIIGSSSIERDITSTKNREAELRDAKQAAEAANHAKTEFLANISHELRTPMNAVLGMLDLALGEDLGSPTEGYLHVARESGDTLLHLLNDLLDFSRMEAGRFELESEPFSLRKTLDAAMKSLSLRASERGLELVCHVSPEVPDDLKGDARRLRQVMVNLAGNSVKFTKQGEVVVDVHVESRKGNRVTLRFSVCDTGIGIPPEDQDRIFAPFAQVDASMTRQHTGSGLGLAICREIVEALGGRIWLDSQVGRGTTFFCTATFEVLADDASGHAHELTGLPVLVVDDNESNRRTVAEMLANWDMKPEIAKSSKEALRLIESAHHTNRPYPLIIVDALMPQLDGLALIEILQKRSTMSAKTVLMVSPADRQMCEGRFQGLDIAAYLEKPISHSDMLDAVMTALNGAPQRQAKAIHHKSERPSLRVLVAEDTPANQKVVQAILEKRGHFVEVAHNGRETVDRLEEDDYDVVLMDIQMPTMDGLQASQAIRHLSAPRKAEIPIIAMTAHARFEDRRRCLGAGMDAYIAKPIDATALIELVETVEHQPNQMPVSQGTTMEQSQPSDQLTNPKPNLAKQSSGGIDDVINLETALARMGGDKNLLSELMQFFLEDAPKILNTADQALTDGNQEELQRAAHSLKGLAASFDAYDAMSSATRLEQIGRKDSLADGPEALKQLRVEVDRLSDVLRSAKKQLI